MRKSARDGWRRAREAVKGQYLQEDTQRSTRDYSIGGSCPQHIESSRESGRRGRPSRRPTGPAAARTGRSSRLASRPDLFRAEIRVELVPRVPHRRVAVADVDAPRPDDDRLRGAVAAADDEVVSVEVEQLDGGGKERQVVAVEPCRRAGSHWTNDARIRCALDARPTPSPGPAPACRAARPDRARRSPRAPSRRRACRSASRGRAPLAARRAIAIAGSLAPAPRRRSPARAAIERSQENSRDPRRARAARRSRAQRRASDQHAAHRVGDRRRIRSGSISSAASPTTSGSDETFEVITGVPLAIASSGGSPKPS